MMKSDSAKPFALLLDWMKRTGHSQKDLLALLEKETGVVFSPQHLSRVLGGHWGFSLPAALAISRTTGVPVENLAAPPKIKRDKQSRAAASAGEAA